MKRKYLTDVGDPLVFLTHIGPNMASFKFYFTSRGGFSKTPFYILKFRRPTRPIVFFMGSVELCVKGGVKLLLVVILMY